MLLAKFGVWQVTSVLVLVSHVRRSEEAAVVASLLLGKVLDRHVDE